MRVPTESMARVAPSRLSTTIPLRLRIPLMTSVTVSIGLSLKIAAVGTCSSGAM